MTEPQTQPAEAVKLIPCPFGPPPEHLPPIVKEVKGTQDTYWWVGCEIHLSPSAPPVGCGVGHSALTREEAIAKWQSRADLPRAAADALGIINGYIDECGQALDLDTTSNVERLRLHYFKSAANEILRRIITTPRAQTGLTVEAAPKTWDDFIVAFNDKYPRLPVYDTENCKFYVQRALKFLLIGSVD